MKSLQSLLSFFVFVMTTPVLLASSGVNLDVDHFYDEMLSFNLLDKAISCHQLAVKINGIAYLVHQAQNEDDSDKKDCCDNESFLIQPDADQLLRAADLNADHTVKDFMAGKSASYLSLMVVMDETKKNPDTPPPWIKDYQSDHQIFLL